MFNPITHKNRAFMRDFSNRYAKNAAAHVSKLEKYQTNPFTAHNEPLSDEKQKT
jgi:hypothetical protein